MIKSLLALKTQILTLQIDPPLMASSLFFLITLFLLHQPHSCTANLFKAHLLNSHLFSQSTPLNHSLPTQYFEVTKPIKFPQKSKPYSYLILHHQFGYTYGKPPILANYTPPSNHPFTNFGKFSKIVLEWKATSYGRQFDRIFGVWIGGVEVLRSCTAEPRSSGIVWSVEKDITRYYSLLMKDQILAVYLGNLVNSVYTGVYHVDLTIHFYPVEEHLKSYELNLSDSISGFGNYADLILPISQNLPLKDGLWFEIQNDTDSGVKEFRIPRNVYRAVLEVYVSFHENDESWYANLPNEYIVSNNLTGMPGNGSFREVLVSLDGGVVGAVWPFTVIFTGGVNPLLWRPITAIGSFDLPSYNIEITPFLGKMLDGETHMFEFSVTNALNVWYIDANLHLWLDNKSTRTEAKLMSHISMPLLVSLKSDFQGANGTFLTRVSRSIESTGWVKSSSGKIITQSIQDFNYSNSMVMGKNGNMQIVNQTINFNDNVYAKVPSSDVHSIKSNKSFSLYMCTDSMDQGNETSLYVTDITLGFNVDESKDAGFGLSTGSLTNFQIGNGYMTVKNNLVINGLGSTQQVYKYDGSNFCYFRNISSSNYTILYDKVENMCNKRPQAPSGSFPSGRALLASNNKEV